MNIIVTGGGGYIGKLLIKKLSGDDSVKSIIGIDTIPQPEDIKQISKVAWIQADLATKGWEEKLPPQLPIDVVIHCAFKIRNPYGEKNIVKKENFASGHAVFGFSIRRNASKIIYLSTVSAYGAKPENIGKLLSENEPLSEKENPYGCQKIEAENDLTALIKKTNSKTQAFILRLNSITGPVGQSMGSKFGLITFLKKLLPFIIEANPYWARQFVHEEDLVEIIYLLTVKNILQTGRNPEVFNIAPPNFLTARDMSKLLNKRILKIPAWSVKPLFSIAWHGSLGRIPTRPDSAMGLIYPINVDGSRIENVLGFHYSHTAQEAFLAQNNKLIQ